MRFLEEGTGGAVFSLKIVSMVVIHYWCCFAVCLLVLPFYCTQQIEQCSTTS